jgi:hypothetical protein
MNTTRKGTFIDKGSDNLRGQVMIPGSTDLPAIHCTQNNIWLCSQKTESRRPLSARIRMPRAGGGSNYHRKVIGRTQTKQIQKRDNQVCTIYSRAHLLVDPARETGFAIRGGAAYWNVHVGNKVLCYPMSACASGVHDETDMMENEKGYHNQRQSRRERFCQRPAILRAT